jgi:hypothetical protein
MPTAIEQIVNVFVSLGSRRQLEDMKLQRERVVLELLLLDEHAEQIFDG